MSGGQPGYRTVRLACDGGVATITLNRPQKRNPLSAETAEELMLTGETIDAGQAERIGLFTHVVPHDQLMPRAHDLASRIAAGPPLGLRFTKRGLFRSVWSGLERDLDWEAAVQTICTRSEDFEEAWKAYFEKRAPRFRGT